MTKNRKKRASRGGQESYSQGEPNAQKSYSMTTEDKREKALVELAQAAREWFEVTDYDRDQEDDIKPRRTRATRELREVISRNWLLLH